MKTFSIAFLLGWFVFGCGSLEDDEANTSSMWAGDYKLSAVKVVAGSAGNIVYTVKPGCSMKATPKGDGWYTINLVQNCEAVDRYGNVMPLVGNYQYEYLVNENGNLEDVVVLDEPTSGDDDDGTSTVTSVTRSFAGDNFNMSFTMYVEGIRATYFFTFTR